jgi:uncharacterized protein YdhG (YjbR/CyaY superfamily)
MTKSLPIPRSVDEYVAAAELAARPILNEIRRVVRAAAPDAEEVVSYRMPAFKQGGVLIYFAAFRHHIGVFPPVSGDAALERALKPYAGPKGNLKFPLDRPIPYALIARIVRLRLKRNLAKTAKRPPGKARAGRDGPKARTTRARSGGR